MYREKFYNTTINSLKSIIFKYLGNVTFSEYLNIEFSKWKIEIYDITDHVYLSVNYDLKHIDFNNNLHVIKAINDISADIENKLYEKGVI